MVLDASALIAILQGEETAPRLVAAIEGDPSRWISAGTLIEAGLVLQARYGDHGERELDHLLHRAEVEVLPVTEFHADLARSAFRRFGKGRHPAGLNFGDTFAYALSVALSEPLLFVGLDFSKTDVRAVEY